MRSTLFAATAIAAALALPLAGHAAPNASTMNPNGNATGSAGANSTVNPSDNNGASASANPTTNNSETANNNQTTSKKMARSGAAKRNIIRADLKKAGFSNIHVSPMAFVATAKDRNGRPVVMAFRPHSFEAVTLLNAGKARNGSETQNNAQ